MNMAEPWSMICTACGADLGGVGHRAASICLRVRGDEETRTYFRCTACDVYSVWIGIEDFFTDNEVTFVRGPIPRAQGDAIVAKIRQCPAPANPACRRPTHEDLSSSR